MDDDDLIRQLAEELLLPNQEDANVNVDMGRDSVSEDEMVDSLLQGDTSEQVQVDQQPHNQQPPGQPPQQQEFQCAKALTHFFGDPAFLVFLGNDCQRKLFQRFWNAYRYGQGQRDPERVIHLPVGSVTKVVVESFLESSTLKSIATVAEESGKSKQTIGRAIQQTACVLLQGISWIQGTGLNMWRSLFNQDKLNQNRYKPLLCISKLRYDETPLRMRIDEYNMFLGASSSTSASGSDYRFAKILRTEWELGWLVIDKFTGDRQLFTTMVPVPLSAIERNTAECISAVLKSNLARLPEMRAFAAAFQSKLSMSVVDRFSANFRAEAHMKSLSGDTSLVLTCAVHKIASSTKRATNIHEDTLSGLVNLALSLEGAGNLDSLRRIMQEIFEDELLIIHDQPPEGDVAAHRRAVLDLCIPISGSRKFQGKQGREGSPSIRWQIQTYLNLKSSTIVLWDVVGASRKQSWRSRSTWFRPFYQPNYQ